jgi:hypothetical protein
LLAALQSAEPPSQYLIGDSRKAGAFLALDIRMGPGQSEVVRTPMPNDADLLDLMLDWVPDE